MKITKETPKREFGVAGVVLTAPEPFKEGSVLTANEAGSMNQTLVENIRNNLATKIKEMVKAKKPKAEMQTMVDTYTAEYEFGVKRTGGTKDPVMAEAVAMALIKVKEALVKQGKKIADFKLADLKVKAAEVVAKHPQFMEKAKKIVAARSASMDDLKI